MSAEDPKVKASVETMAYYIKADQNARLRWTFFDLDDLSAQCQRTHFPTHSLFGQELMERRPRLESRYERAGSRGLSAKPETGEIAKIQPGFVSS